MGDESQWGRCFFFQVSKGWQVFGMVKNVTRTQGLSDPQKKMKRSRIESPGIIISNQNHMSNEKNLGWLGHIGDYTTQLYRAYNKPL